MKLPSFSHYSLLFGYMLGTAREALREPFVIERLFCGTFDLQREKLFFIFFIIEKLNGNKSIGVVFLYLLWTAAGTII
jgi:hypothetical protein